ncbi:MAG: helix-turn-helix transcriptional regulator [Firmicutes bacterium]|jgi:transcriptional regulator with XRE-family HTH domain|nr:helix-turn-helix transcriptional regulator [Bacillota bacterium]
MLKKLYLNDGIIQRIKQKRKEKGYTQEKMAELLNISYSNYSKIENAVVTPTLERLVDISQILDMSLDYLVYGKQNNDETTYFCDNTQEKDIISLFKDCDKEKLLYIIHFLQKIYSLL